MAKGGGEPALQLTAELVARAIIAAALSLGDDPVKAMTCPRTAPERRSVTAAADGLRRAGAEWPEIERVTRVMRGSVYAMRHRGGFAVDDAARAAALACGVRLPAPLGLKRPSGPALETRPPTPPVVRSAAPAAPARPVTLAGSNRAPPPIAERAKREPQPRPETVAPETSHAPGLTDEDRLHLKLIARVYGELSFPVLKIGG